MSLWGTNESLDRILWSQVLAWFFKLFYKYRNKLALWKYDSLSQSMHGVKSHAMISSKYSTIDKKNHKNSKYSVEILISNGKYFYLHKKISFILFRLVLRK